MKFEYPEVVSDPVHAAMPQLVLEGTKDARLASAAANVTATLTRKLPGVAGVLLAESATATNIHIHDDLQHGGSPDQVGAPKSRGRTMAQRPGAGKNPEFVLDPVASEHVLFGLGKMATMTGLRSWQRQRYGLVNRATVRQAQNALARLYIV